MRDYTDGTSNTVMVVEKFRGRRFINMRCSNSHWTADGWDGTCDPVESEDLTGFECGVWGYEASYCGADASSGPNSKTIDDISYADAHSSGNGHTPASSAHAGGIFVLMVDGSGHFVSDSVDLTVWRNTCSFGGGEKNTVQFDD